MIFKLSAQRVADTGCAFIVKPGVQTVFAVGDTFKGWLSSHRESHCAHDLRRKLNWYGMISLTLHVLESNGRRKTPLDWQLVSVSNCE